MRTSSVALSHIQLDTPQKLDRWKQNIKKLFRKVGKRQKEVAIEMSMLAQKQGEQVVHSSFISPLSRFCNGKGSAFPTWFQREEERLELFARAMGFSTTDPIWEVLENSLDYRPPPQKWHDGFPNLFCRVPIRLNGERIDDIASRYTDTADKLGHIFLIGPKGSGKRTTASEIQERLQQQAIELSIQNEMSSLPSIICLEQKPHQIRNQDLMFEMPKWGLTEIEYLISYFQTENLDVFALQYWYSKIQENRQWLPLDCRPQTIIALCSFLLLLPQRDLPQNPKQLRYLLLSKTIDKTVTGKLRHISFDDVALLCAKVFFTSHATWRFSQVQIEKEIQTFSNNNTVDEKIYLQLEELIHCSSTKRKELVLQLQETLLPNVDVQLEVLVQSGFLSKIEDEYSFSDPLIANCLAVWGFSSLSEFPIWKCMLVENNFDLLEEFLLLNEDIQSHQIQEWQKKCPPEFAYEWNWIVLFFADRNISFRPQLIQQAWASCLMGMSRQVFLSPQQNKKRTNVLHRISKSYSHILPLMPTFDVINDLCPPEVSAIFTNWIVPQVVDFRKLSPFQFPPQSIEEMETFLGNDVNILWRVLDLWANQGHVQSQLLLSEGFKYSKWSSIPLLYRIMYIGTHQLTHQSKQALQLLILEGYSENQSHFEQFVIRIGPKNLLDLILRFFEPLHICQQYQIQPQTELISFSICVIRHLEQFDLIQNSFDVLLQFIRQDEIIKRGRITHNKKSILVSLSEEELILHIVSILEQIAQIAYELDIREPIYNLFEFSKDRDLSSQHNIIAFLIVHQDNWLIQKWLDGFEMELFRENLASNEDLLKKTWQQDEEEKRLLDILMISCLHDPIPNWIIAIARKELEHNGTWPNWLSPYRKDALSLIHFGYEKVHMEYRLWWAFQLHRHKAFCSEIIQTLQYWLLEEQIPFRDCPAEPSKEIFSTQMPIFTSQELLRLLQDFSRQKIKSLPPWFFNGMLRLWNICAYENNPQTLIVGKICHDIGITNKLFDGDWMVSNGTLLRWLTEKWIEIRQLEEIKSHMKREDTVGILIRDHLLYKNDLETILYLENLFLETGDSIALRKLVVIANYEPLPLLKKLLKKQPTWKKLLIQVANNMVPLSKQGVELQCWIREISI